jgi:outer membrane biosynthesis protein TonB
MPLPLESKNKTISGISTAIICIIMILLFWLYKFHFESAPLVEEDSAVAVSLGDPNNGGPELVPIQAESAASSSQSTATESVEQTTDPDAVASKQSTDKPSNPNTSYAPTPKEDDLLNSLKNGKKNQQGAAAGDGPNFGAQGDPHGKQGGDPHGTLGGSGNGGIGTSHSFGIRKFYLGSGKNNCNEEGKVILEVTLMPDGKIRFDNVSPKSNGSDCLEKVAINYLRSSSFNVADNPISIEGTITFTFKLR